MKRILCIAAIACLLCLCSCRSNVGTDVPDGTLRFENDIVDYTFCYPDNWRVASENGVSSVEFTSSTGRSAKISVMAFDTDAASVNDYWKDYQKDIEATFSGYNALELDTDELMLDDAPAKKVAYTASYGASENVYRFDQVICLRNGTVYIITFSALESDYTSYSSALDTVTSYFDFK